MNRNLTEKEKEFLLELRELMDKYNCMLSAREDRVCFEIDYSGDEDFEPVALTEPITDFYDLDEFIEQNS